MLNTQPSFLLSLFKFQPAKAKSSHQSDSHSQSNDIALDISFLLWSKIKLKYLLWSKMAFLVAQKVKSPPAVQETRVWSLGQEDPLNKEMATDSSILAWKIPWTEKPGRLQSMGSQRVRHNWATKHTHTYQGTKRLHRTTKGATVLKGGIETSAWTWAGWPGAEPQQLTWDTSSRNL